MTIEDLYIIGTKLPGVTTDIKWEDHLCFNIGGKMFLLTSPDRVPPTASFKADGDQFEELIARPGVTPSKYLGRYKWVQVEDIDILDRKEWEDCIKISYRLVASKLPRKLKIEIGLK